MNGFKQFCLAKQFGFLDADVAVVGKPQQFSMFGREIPRETIVPGR